MTLKEKNAKAHAVVEALKAFLDVDRKIGISFNPEDNTIALNNFEAYLNLQKALSDYEGLPQDESKSDAGGTEKTE